MMTAVLTAAQFAWVVGPEWSLGAGVFHACLWSVIPDRPIECDGLWHEWAYLDTLARVADDWFFFAAAAGVGLWAARTVEFDV